MSGNYRETKGNHWNEKEYNKNIQQNNRQIKARNFGQLN